MNCRIPYRTGRVAILSDLHIDSYMSAGRDVITSLGFETVIKDDLDAPHNCGRPERWACCQMGVLH